MVRLVGLMVFIIGVGTILASGAVGLARQGDLTGYLMIVESSHESSSSPLYLITHDGAVLRRLTDDRGGPETYAPVGDWLYYTSTEDSGLYRVHVWEGRASRTRLFPEASYAVVRGWLKDGDYVVVSTQHYTPTSCVAEMRVARPDGSDWRPLPTSLGDEQLCLTPRFLTPSPDGRYWAGYQYYSSGRHHWVIIPPDLLDTPTESASLPLKYRTTPYTMPSPVGLITMYPDGRSINFSDWAARHLTLQLPNDDRVVIWDFGGSGTSSVSYYRSVQYLTLYHPATATSMPIMAGYGTAVETHPHEPIVWLWWNGDTQNGMAYDARSGRLEPDLAPGPLQPRSTTMFGVDGLYSVTEPMPARFLAMVAARGGFAKYIAPVQPNEQRWDGWSYAVGALLLVGMVWMGARR